MIRLYAKAALYSPPAVKLKVGSFELPELPKIAREKTININNKHCQQYNTLTQWQSDIAAVVHPNYIQTLSLAMQLDMMISKPFPFKPIGLVHVANQIDVSFLPEQNAVISLKTEFGQVFYHRRGWLFEVITRANVAGICAITGTSYYLARHKHSVEANKYFQSLNQSDTHAVDQKIDQHKDQGLPDWIMHLGQDFLIKDNSPEELMFTADIGRRYAKVSGDYNPIHLYPYTAKLLGFKKAIAHGMYSKAWAVSKIAKKLPFYKSSFCLKTLFMQPIMLPLSTQLAVSEQGPHQELQQMTYFSLNSTSGNKTRTHLIGSISNLA